MDRARIVNHGTGWRSTTKIRRKKKAGSSGRGHKRGVMPNWLNAKYSATSATSAKPEKKRGGRSGTALPWPTRFIIAAAICAERSMPSAANCTRVDAVDALHFRQLRVSWASAPEATRRRCKRRTHSGKHRWFESILAHQLDISRAACYDD